MHKPIIAFFKNKVVLIGIGALAIIGIGYTAFGNGPIVYETLTVKRGTVTQQVSVTGKTKPSEEVSLAFEKSGRVVAVSTEVGSHVRKGQTIVSLDQSELGAQLEQAQATLLSSQATLDQLKRGARPEDIKIKETEIAKATQDLNNEYGSVLNLLQESYNDAEQAIREDIDALFLNDESQNVSLSFETTASQAQINALSLRVKMSHDLKAWRASLDTLQISAHPSKLDTGLTEASSYLAGARTFLNALTDATIAASTSTVNSYIGSINTARTTINAAATAISTQVQDIAVQKVTVQRLADELAFKLAGSDPDEIRSKEALVKQNEANVSIIYAQLGKLRLVAPIDGVITKQDAKRGEIIAANTPLVGIISENDLEIEANIPEVDVAKVAVGNNVSITLDAFPSETFTGTVTQIDPAETLVDGVVNYKMDIAFTDPSASKVKSGLTANVWIETVKRENVLVLPQRALREEKDGVFVDKRVNGTITSSPVTIGIRSTDGTVEILSGVTDGEEVVAETN